jgi:threonine/homoserine/homoserine lactone efflux protein
VPVDSIVAFWGVALLLILVPGPDWAFTISAGVRHRATVPAVAGLAIGYAAMTLVVAAGVGAVVARSPAALTVLTLVGGAYLIRHGVMTWRRPSSERPDAGAATGSSRAILARGIGVSGLNPKGLLVFLALLLALLGLVFTATCAAFYLALGTCASTVLQNRGRSAAAVTRIAGIGMVIVGALLILDRALG